MTVPKTNCLFVVINLTKIHVIQISGKLWLFLKCQKVIPTFSAFLIYIYHMLVRILKFILKTSAIKGTCFLGSSVLSCRWKFPGTSQRTLHVKYQVTIGKNNWAVTCDFQQCGILTCVDSDEPLQPPFKLRNSEWCSGSSLTIIEYSND